MSKISQIILENLLKQASIEFKASNGYLFSALWLDLNHYPGAAKYFKYESKNEYQHGSLILDYLVKRGQLPSLPLFEPHNLKFEKPLDIFFYYFTKENENLHNLQQLSSLAYDHKDVLTIEFLSKYLNEQLDSVSEAELIYNKAKFYTSIPGLFYHLDHELEKKAK